MMNFCTLFDSYYIIKGLALYDSLCKTCGDDFTLYISAGDKDSYNKLTSLHLKHAVIESFEDDIETPELLAVKPARTKAEYCWTCGPTVIYHFIQKYGLEDLTYLDADLYFFSSPQVVYDEIGDNSIAITEHFIEVPEYAGKYCVQYMFFRNDEEGMAALMWWRDRCIEWCYSRYEDGKFGDQKYLEQFPVRYNKVCVVQNRGVGVAPWNMNTYGYSDTEIVHDGSNYPIVFFHYHGLKTDLVDSELIMHINDMTVRNDQIRALFLNPYLEALKDVYENYLGREIARTGIVELSTCRKKWKRIKYRWRSNPIARFFWYKVFKVKYSGFESKKI